MSSLVALAIVGLILTRTPARAHHSSAPFYDDTKRVEAVGTVERFLFRNPHSFIFIRGDSGSGQTVEWEVELGAAVSMRRSGWTPETIKAGDMIKATGQPSRAPGTYGMCCAQLSRPDGSPIRP
jgi:hypothetical protein